MDAGVQSHIDFAQLSSNLGHDQELISELLGLFLSSTADSLEKMNQHETERHVLGWKKTAHHIKGAAQNITAKRLVMLCLEAEEINALPHPQSSAVLYHLYKELAILREAIDHYLVADDSVSNGE